MQFVPEHHLTFAAFASATTVSPVISRRQFAIFLAVSFAAAVQSAVAAESYIVVDAQTGYVLTEHESRQKRQIGGLATIAAAAVALDWAEHKGGSLDQTVTIPSSAFVGTLENNIGFQPNDEIALRDLLYAALVQSDNIAAYTLASFIGSTIQGPAQGAKMTPVDVFVTQMNALAKQLKMERTRFVNPHGIDQNVRPPPYSTAEDLARLTRYVTNKASFRFYVSQKERQISFHRGGKELHYLLKNTNDLVGTNGIDGVKTGRTARAGDCLVLSANRESEIKKYTQGVQIYPRHIIVVLLASPNRFGEGAALVAQGWQLYDQWAAGGRLVDPQKLL